MRGRHEAPDHTDVFMGVILLGLTALLVAVVILALVNLSARGRSASPPRGEQVTDGRRQHGQRMRTARP